MVWEKHKQQEIAITRRASRVRSSPSSYGHLHIMLRRFSVLVLCLVPLAYTLRCANTRGPPMWVRVIEGQIALLATLRIDVAQCKLSTVITRAISHHIFFFATKKVPNCTRKAYARQHAMANSAEDNTTRTPDQCDSAHMRNQLPNTPWKNILDTASIN